MKTNMHVRPPFARQCNLGAALMLVLLLATVAHAQLTPSGDAYTNTADPTTNYGASKLLDIESSQTTYIQFNLSSIPAGYASSDITKATLKLYVNTATKAGSFNVDYVNGTWTESTITASTAPALGTTIAASVPITTADKNQYILIDITAAVQAWLSGTANDGIALVGNSPVDATFDSKESTTTSHPPELDIVFAGGGTITGITTANGSGLTGGGTSGTLNLSLLTSCSNKQVLQWSGTVWTCSSAGTGTITGVTAGADLTGGGTSGNVTLNLDTTKVPQLSGNNTFTNNNAVSVNSSNPGLTLANTNGDGLDVSGGVGGNGIYVSGAGGYGVYVNSSGNNGVVGFGDFDGGYFHGISAGTYSENDTDSNFSVAAYGNEYGSTKETFGVWGYSASNIGVGTYGVAPHRSNEGTIYGGSGAWGVWGDTNSNSALGAGVLATGDDNYGLVVVNNSNSGWPTSWFENDETTDPTYLVFTTYGGGFHGNQCVIDVSGDLSCTGSITPVVPVGGSRKVALNTISSPEHWFEDAGSGQLSNGEALVNIEAVFGETVNTGMEYHVFLTPNGDCKGLYVAQKSPGSFVVRELGGGTSSVAFDYRIMAKRKGFEQLRLVDKTEQMNAPRPKRAVGGQPAMPTAQEIRKAQEAHLHTARVTQPVLKTK
jgi:hypothetical protein